MKKVLPVMLIALCMVASVTLLADTTSVSGQIFTGDLSESIVQILGTILVAVVNVFGVLAIAWLKKKYDIDASAQIEFAVDYAVQKGVVGAEEWARNQIKNNKSKIKGIDKAEKAYEIAMQFGGDYLKKYDRATVVNMIVAKVGEIRSENGGELNVKKS